MSYALNWKGSNVVITYNCNLTFQDIYELNNIIYGDSRFETMRYQILDWTKVEKFEISKKEVKIISTLEKSSTRWNNKVKLAIVVTDKEYLKAIEPYLKVMKSTNWEIKIFENIFECEKWCTI